MKCLERSIRKQIRKELRGLGLRPRSVIAVYIPQSLILEGTLLLRLLSDIESVFGTAVVGFVPKSCSDSIQEYIIDVPNSSLLPYDEAEVAFPYLIPHSISEASNLAMNFEPLPKAVLLPFTLTDLNEAFLDALIVKQKALKVLKDSYLRRLFWTVMPFKELHRRDIYALAYALELIRLLNRCPPSLGPTSEIAEMIHEIEMHHSELSYRMKESVETLLLKYKVSTLLRD